MPNVIDWMKQFLGARYCPSTTEQSNGYSSPSRVNSNIISALLGGPLFVTNTRRVVYGDERTLSSTPTRLKGGGMNHRLAQYFNRDQRQEYTRDKIINVLLPLHCHLSSILPHRTLRHAYCECRLWNIEYWARITEYCPTIEGLNEPESSSIEIIRARIAFDEFTGRPIYENRRYEMRNILRMRG